MIRPCWRHLFAVGASVSLVAAACTVTTGSDTGSGGSGGDSGSAGDVGGTDSTGGSGGSGGDAGNGGATTGGTSAGGTGAAGSGGEAGDSGGTGGEMPLACEFDPEDDAPAYTTDSCEEALDDEEDCCTRCLVSQCCEETGACLGTPFNACGGDAKNENSEINCILGCMLDLEPIREDGLDLDYCVEQDQCYASSDHCEAGTLSETADALATCMHGTTSGDIDDIEDDPGCFDECFYDHSDDDSYVCPY